MRQIETMQLKLAESQAREAKLRKALKVVISFELSNACVGDTDDLCYEFRIAAKALNIPTDDTALREMIERAGEAMREWCKDEAFLHGHCIDNAIRALPGVSLEDLK